MYEKVKRVLVFLCLFVQVKAQHEVYNVSLLFFLGVDGAKTGVIQSLIDKEAERFGDLVQENFIDTYRCVSI